MPTYKDKRPSYWYSSFYYTEWQGNKKRKVKLGFATQREAKEYERQFLTSEQKECDINFATLVEDYFKDSKTRLRQNTLIGKQYLFEQKILPYFRKLSLNKITPATIRQWQNEILDMEYSPTYTKTINNQLSAIFNYAMRYYNLPSNPCRTVGSIGKANAETMQIWTKEQFEKAISYEDRTEINLALSILFWSGIRHGELLALTPKDVLPTKELSITKTFNRIDGKAR